MTNRRAFAGAPHSSEEAAESPLQTLRERIRSAATTGVDWIQIREKDLETRALAELVRLAIKDTRETRARILVNDRLDVAIAAGAHGIHLGEQSIPVEAVSNWRRSAGRPEFQIGISCHSLEAAHAAERDGANYIIFGPVFATPSKAAYGPPQGIDSLRAVCAGIKIPVLAIGGVTLKNMPLCITAGAAGIAAIRLFQGAEDLKEVVHLADKSL